MTVPRPRTSSPLKALRSITAAYAQLANSLRAAVRNLAYLHNDLADPALRRHLLRLSRAARTWYEQLLAAAVAAGELRADTDIQALARSIEVTLRGSFLSWILYREGSAAHWLREDLNATLEALSGAWRQPHQTTNMRSACVVSAAEHAGGRTSCAWRHRATCRPSSNDDE